MDSQTKQRKRRRDRIGTRKDKPKNISLIREAEVRLDARKPDFVAPILNRKITPLAKKKPTPVPILSSEELAAKISEAEEWIEEIKKLEVNENTDIEKKETVLLLREMFKELTQITSSDETIRIVSHKIHQVIQQKRNEISTLKKRARKKQRQVNKKIDLKHYEGSAADKLLDLVAERKSKNKELITSLLDRIWRKSMNGGTLNGKDFEAIEAAKNFLREVGLNIS